MHAEPSTHDTTKLQLPPDLLAELQRRGPAPRDDLRVEGWKPSLLGRVVELLAGRRARGA